MNSIVFSEEWRTKTKKQIRECFELFDKDKSDTVVIEEVSTIMRMLGVYPSEKALVTEILTEMQGDEPSGFIQFSRFETKMIDMLQKKEWAPDEPYLLLQCFRMIDQEGRGCIEATRLEELLTTRGTPFRPKELEAFMHFAKDGDGFVYYEDLLDRFI